MPQLDHTARAGALLRRALGVPAGTAERWRSTDVPTTKIDPVPHAVRPIVAAAGVLLVGVAAEHVVGGWVGGAASLVGILLAIVLVNVALATMVGGQGEFPMRGAGSRFRGSGPGSR